ncbi:MAG: hypothetical protein HRU09_13120 [Oligoflexales bacterium]|nr:hypothetical protein [Oligoflexales bacterium]
MKKAFYVSLFFNVLFLGIVCGYLLHQVKGPIRKWQFKNQLRSSLSDHAKIQFDDWLNLVSKKPKFRNKRREIMRIFEADEFDRAAFIKLSDELKQEHIDRIDLFSRATLNLASKLDASERKQLAKHLPHLARPKRPKHKRLH